MQMYNVSVKNNYKLQQTKKMQRIIA